MAELYIFALIGYVVYKCIDKEALRRKLENMEE